MSDSSPSFYPQIKVADAISQHKSLLSKIREKCKIYIDLDPEQFDDDLFLVRFCLSHKGNEEKAITAVKASIDFRYKNREILEKLENGYEHPHETKVKKYVPMGVHQNSLKDPGSLLYVIRGGIGNVDLLLENCTDEEIKNAMIFSKELIHAQLDRATRQTGVIKKLLICHDLFNNSMFDLRRKFMNIMQEVSNSMNMVYPQLISKIVIVNAISITGLYSVLAVAKSVMNESLAEKIVCCGAETLTMDLSPVQNVCPFVSSFVNIDHLPTFLGGKCRCEEKGGCIVVPNDLRTKIGVKVEENDEHAA